MEVTPQERLRARIAEQGLPPEHDQKRIAEQSVHFPVFLINLSSVPSVPTMLPAKWIMKRAILGHHSYLPERSPLEVRDLRRGKVLTGSQARPRSRDCRAVVYVDKPDAGENDSSIPQRNPRIPSASAEGPWLAYPALVNAKLTRAKAGGMQTPAAESCIEDDLVVLPDQQTQGRLCLTATHTVEEFIACAPAGMSDNPADPQLISRICHT